MIGVDYWSYSSVATASGRKFFDVARYDCTQPTWPGTTACGSGVLFARNTADGQLEEFDFSPVDVSRVHPEG